MSDAQKTLARESIVLRILWMVIYAIVWQVGELVLLAVVVVQLGHRLFYGALSAGLLSFGDSLSQYLAQIGRFGTFNTDEKPWPFADWPAPQAAQGEQPQNVAPAAQAPAEQPKG